MHICMKKIIKSPIFFRKVTRTGTRNYFLSSLIMYMVLYDKSYPVPWYDRNKRNAHCIFL